MGFTAINRLKDALFPTPPGTHARRDMDGHPNKLFCNHTLSEPLSDKIHSGQVMGGNVVAGRDAARLEDISQLIRLTANALEAHSVFFLVPTKYLEALKIPGFSTANNRGSSFKDSGSRELYTEGAPKGGVEMLPLTSHTLSPEALPEAQLPISTGPLCWVARTGRPLQITPFESDARVLGIYGRTIELKSLAAIPVSLPPVSRQELQGALRRSELSALGSNVSADRRENGVLVVDSLKSYSFTDQKMKLLSQLGDQLKRLMELHAVTTTSWCHEDATIPEPELQESELKASLRSLVERHDMKGLAAITVTQYPANLNQFEDREIQEREITFRLPSVHGDWRTLFPKNRFLSLSKRIEKVWRSACHEMAAEASSGAAISGAGLTAADQSPTVMLLSPTALVLVADRLRAPFLLRQAKAIFCHHLKRELVHIIRDPRSTIFNEIASQMFSFQQRSCLDLIQADERPLAQQQRQSHLSLEEEWLSHALTQIQKLLNAARRGSGKVTSETLPRFLGQRTSGPSQKKNSPHFQRFQYQMVSTEKERAEPMPPTYSDVTIQETPYSHGSLSFQEVGFEQDLEQTLTPAFPATRERRRA